MNKIYKVDPAMYYLGFALIAAPNAATANEMIAEYKTNDPTNRWDSFGFTYVTEEDVIDDIYSDLTSIVYNCIQYCG